MQKHEQYNLQEATLGLISTKLRNYTNDEIKTHLQAEPKAASQML